MKESFRSHPHPNLPPQGGGRLPRTVAQAISLRKKMTKAEVRLWSKLRMRQLHGWKFRRQAPVGPYIADFLCHSPAMIVELDGDQHAWRITHDLRRDAFLRSEGFLVLRFWNNEVFTNIDGVLQRIGIEGWKLASPPPLAGEDLGGGEP